MPLSLKKKKKKPSHCQDQVYKLLHRELSKLSFLYKMFSWVKTIYVVELASENSFHIFFFLEGGSLSFADWH